MAKAAQQTGRASRQPKERDTTPQVKTEAGGADKQATSTDDASDNLQAFRVVSSRPFGRSWTSGPKMTLRCSK